MCEDKCDGVPICVSVAPCSGPSRCYGAAAGADIHRGTDHKPMEPTKRKTETVNDLSRCLNALDKRPLPAVALAGSGLSTRSPGRLAAWSENCARLPAMARSRAIRLK
jgi:hypothetical protein